MNRIRLLVLTPLLVAAVAIGFVAARLTQDNASEMTVQSGESGERQVLYWVAPMDPNYRRDEPGKSPMGMDLIPVYADEEAAKAGEVPSLKINAAIVNNIGVRTALVERATLHQQIHTVGFIAPNEDRLGHVHIRTAGWIEELFVKTEGETVAPSDILFRFYSPALVNAQAEYLQARRQGNVAFVRAARDRLTALGMTAHQIDAVTAAGEVQQLTDIRAHHAGTILTLGAREGMYVEPGTMIMDLADLSSVWVLVDIYEDHAAWVEEGQAAAMRLDFAAGKIWHGMVDYVYPTVDPKSRTIRVRLVFANADGFLKPNMYANVVIEAVPAPGALTIPQAALIRSSSGDRVILALGEGRFRPARVVAGIESDDKVEILFGLELGERIVTSGQFLIDSEASLDAALLRLVSDTGSPMPSMVDMKLAQPAEAPVATGTGRVKSVVAAARRVVLDHAPIQELGWPAMVMAFDLADDVPIETIKEETAVLFDVRKTDAGYEVFNLRSIAKGEQP